MRFLRCCFLFLESWTMKAFFLICFLGLPPRVLLHYLLFSTFHCLCSLGHSIDDSNLYHLLDSRTAVCFIHTVPSLFTTFLRLIVHTFTTIRSSILQSPLSARMSSFTGSVLGSFLLSRVCKILTLHRLIEGAPPFIRFMNACE